MHVLSAAYNPIQPDLQRQTLKVGSHLYSAPIITGLLMTTRPFFLSAAYNTNTLYLQCKSVSVSQTAGLVA